MARRRIAWDRAEDGTSAHGNLGPVDVRVWRDREHKKGFLWQIHAFAPDRDQALEAAEAAVLASTAPSFDPEWLKSLTHHAHAGTAYLMVDGVRDTTSLLGLCQLAMKGANRG